MEAFQPLIAFQGHRGRTYRLQLYHLLLDSIALHRVANRPDRFEPRLKKHRIRRYTTLTMSRNETKLAILKGRTKI